MTASPRCRFCLIFLIIFWTAESFAWQQLSSSTAYSAAWPLLACRLGIIFCLTAAAVTALPKWLSAPIMAADALLSLAFYSYWGYFQTELMCTPILTQWREGAAMGGDIFANVSAGAALAMGAALGVKYALLWAAEPPATGLRALARGGAGLAGAAALLVFGNFQMVNMEREFKGASADKNIACYGYLLTWAAEITLTDEKDFFDEHPASRKLAEALPPLTPAEDVIIIQVESLDYGALKWKDKRGRPLTPFLNKLVAAAGYSRVASRSRLGSASADCSVLMQEAVNRKIIPYKLVTYPFNRAGSLPRLARAAGYRVTALHGFDGGFFNRRTAYARMGFDQILFKEDLDALGTLDESTRHSFFTTYGYLDGPMLDLAADLAARPGKDLVFLITLTNHTPWVYLPEAEQKYYPKPKDKFQNFANSINYVDRCLAAFYDRVADGTLLIIYGDHAAVFEELRAGGDFVPYIIWRKGDPLTPRKNPPGIRNQDFILEDIAGHIGTLFAQPMEKEAAEALAP